MAVTHPTLIRTSLAQTILDALDADVGAGSLEFQTSGLVVVATLPLSDPAATISGAVLTFSAITDDTNAIGGTTDRFVVQDNSGDDVFLGSVTASGGGGDIELSTVVIPAAGTVSVTSLTYTAAP